MDDFVRAALLGLVQALTEFLPISSSGHLVVAAELFGDELNDLTFDVGLHLGTTAAVLLYFRRDWVLFAASMQRDLRAHGGRVGSWRPRSRLALLIALATVPAVCVGAAFQLAFEDGLREPVLVGVMLIAVGLVILVLDRAAQMRGLDDLSARGALLIGVAQAAALVPGVSRSGATIAPAAGSGCGARRPRASPSSCPRRWWSARASCCSARPSSAARRSPGVHCCSGRWSRR